MLCFLKILMKIEEGINKIRLGEAITDRQLQLCNLHNTWNTTYARHVYKYPFYTKIEATYNVIFFINGSSMYYYLILLLLLF